MKKTTADTPRSVNVQYKKTRRPQAVAEATGDGYTMTKDMQKGARQKSQFGLPPSPGVRLKISIKPDTDNDKM